MSWEVLAWAMKKGRDYQLQPTTRHVMLTLANYADPEGNDIYPSLSRLELDTGLSERTIRRQIQHLMGCRLLDYGDQRVVEQNPRIRPDQRPKVYRFILEAVPATVDNSPERPDTMSGRGYGFAPKVVDNSGHARTLSPERPDKRPVTVSNEPINQKLKPRAGFADEAADAVLDVLPVVSGSDFVEEIRRRRAEREAEKQKEALDHARSRG
ncbi:helix-turn-helix DNA binding domain protein [Arthrobacter phage Yavru]|uniref:Helix-turn-helix DNA binding domain protein n=1 Tax=Arthrobacter phage Yavru TaxID=2776857 RepID=A0A7M1CIW6_9CAUD|nr:helix-turn-helix DNA binding domain protein [Arthrobacter phage Yavru]QOP64236.1 helix-turn-helix DNA binding domain protein [Arthrobacter phage Yavru]